MKPASSQDLLGRDAAPSCRLSFANADLVAAASGTGVLLAGLYRLSGEGGSGRPPRTGVRRKLLP